ncbi:MAG: 1-(5-phosphoribosyl)-5-[(5-phosphoribosylamino)methylideneamino]imidazole-4-carboxamide isomerase [Acholeplasmataceae bacterium]
MILLPAIDLKDQKCVRLLQGQYDQMTIYSDTPLEVAKSFEMLGASYVHIVDLDGAGDYEGSNESVIQSIAETLKIPIQVGGGIRTLEKVDRLLSYGVSRVIIGTIAIENIELLKRMVDKYPNQVIVSIDAKDGWIATRGWKTMTQIKALDFCQVLEDIGIKTIVYTDIAKDGMLEGPNYKDYEQLSKKTNLDIIASGGISSIDDLLKLKKQNLYGAITGKALYENKFDLKDAIRCLQKESSPV